MLMKRFFHRSLWIALLLVGSGVLPGSARGQAAGDARYLQAGAAVIPGLGVQGGYITPRSFYTVEGMLYVDGSPGFAGGEGSLQVSGGLGGALRILGVLRAVGSPGYQGKNLDVGLRFGPSLFFAFGPSSRDENPFSLFLEPFARATTTLGSSRILYVELGVQRPLLRAGLWFAL